MFNRKLIRMLFCQVSSHALPITSKGDRGA